MEKRKIILSVLTSTMIVGGIITFASVSYADSIDTTTETNQQTSWHNKWMGMFTKGLEEYLDVNSLSWDDLTLYQEALTTLQETMESSRTSTWDQTVMQETMSSAWTTFMESIRTLVSEENLDAFDEFVSAWFQMPTQGDGNFGSGDRANFASWDKPDFGSGNHSQFGSGKWMSFWSWDKPSFGSGERSEIGSWNWEGQNMKPSKGSHNFTYITWDTYTAISTKIEKMSQSKLDKISQKIDAVINSLDSSDANYDMKLELFTELKEMIESLTLDSTTSS